jgi:hypothetical protein
MRHFGCASCGNPGIVVPSRLDDQSQILCQKCGAELGSWGELKQRARRAVLAMGQKKSGVSGDPLPPFEH